MGIDVNDLIPYESIDVSLTAGQARELPGTIRFLQIITCSDPDALQISFGGGTYYNFPKGLYLEDFIAQTFWLKNKSGATITATVGKGNAKLKDSRVSVSSADPVPVFTAVGSPLKVAGEGGVGDPVDVEGKDAHAAAITKNPLLVGAEARSTERAAVATTQLARLVSDLVGKLIVLPYANPENFQSGKTAAMTALVSTAVLVAAGAGVRNYVNTLVITNSHATVGTEVVILDGATELLRVYVPALNGTAGPSTVVIEFPVPLRGTANTAINAQNVTTGSNTYVAAVGYKGA